MGKPKAPTPPDPRQTSAAQTGTNIGTAIANNTMGMVNQVTPYGSLTYSSTGGGSYGGQPSAPAQSVPQAPLSDWERAMRRDNPGIRLPGRDTQPTQPTQGGTGGASGDGFSYTDPYTGQTYNLPQYTATTTLSPEEQAKLDSNQQAEMAMARTAADRGQFLEGYLSQNFDPSGLPDRGQLESRSGELVRDYGQLQSRAGELTRSYGDDFSQDRQRVEDALFSRLSPQLQQQQDQMRTQLLNQGITPGSEAWQRQYDDYNRGSNDARTSVLLAGGQEQSRMAGLEAQRAAFENSATGQAFGMDQAANMADLQRAGFRNAATGSAFNMDAARAGYGDNQRAQALQEAFAMRNQPINEISALLSGSQVQNPMFSSIPTASIATTDVAGQIGQNYNQQLGAWQQNQQNRSSLFGGLFGAGAKMISGGLF